MRFPNGYGSIINLGKKRRKPFAVRITTGVKEVENKDGVKQYRQQYKYLGYFEKRKEAIDFLAKYNADPQAILNNITFKELYEEFKARHCDKLAANTIKDFDVSFNKCKELHDKQFKDITFYHLQKIIDETIHLTTIRKLKAFLNKLYVYAGKYGFKNYATYVDVPAHKKIKDTKEYTKDEIALLWANLDVEYVDILIILLYTGMRVSELLNMKTANVHIKERYMFIEKAKTSAGVRKVPLHKKIMPLIEARYNPNYEFLIVNKFNNQLSYNTLHGAIMRLFKSFNFNHIIHETRHTFISQCNRLNLNDVIVKRLVGHANETITQHYTQVNIDDLLTIIDAFEY